MCEPNGCVALECSDVPMDVDITDPTQSSPTSTGAIKRRDAIIY